MSPSGMVYAEVGQFNTGVCMDWRYWSFLSYSTALAKHSHLGAIIEDLSKWSTVNIELYFCLNCPSLVCSTSDEWL